MPVRSGLGFVPVQRWAELQHSIAVNALGFSAGGRSIVKPATLLLPLSGRTIVLGPNGSGKSTLLQLIHGMLPANQGSVGIRQPRLVERPVGAHELGFVLQRPVMLARSVLDNVTHALAVRGLARAEREPRARRVLARVGLAALESRPARQLSGGEQQRLAIARVMAADPACLLLDEPTAHLDPGASAAIERLLCDWSAAGTGFVMSTHDLAQARRLADQIVFMHRGEVIEFSPANRFFTSPATETAVRFMAGELLE